MNLTDLLKLYGDVQEHEPMSAHTTYKIGGTARWFIQPRSVTALMRIMQLLDAENIPWIVLGRGSNLLVPDGAWPGAVINLDYWVRELLLTAEREEKEANPNFILRHGVKGLRL